MPKIRTIPPTVNKFSSLPINSTSKKRVAAYARVSTDFEDQQNSYEAQVSYYTDYIRNNPEWIFVDVYSDEGISGTSTKNREGFNRMISDAHAGMIDLIITKSISRFARNTITTISTSRELKEKGVEIFFEKENISTFDSKGEFMLTLLSSLAQEESRSISENVLWGYRKKMNDGRFSLAYSSFLGYDRGEDGGLVVNPEEAEIVRLIYTEFLSGLSYQAIATKLTKMGIKTPMGKDTWSHGTVKSILMNEKYKGDALLQKYYTQDYLTKKTAKNHGEMPKIYVENSHEAIIDPETFDRVQVMIEKRKGRSGTSIFASKIKCGDCGAWYGRKVWHSNDPVRRKAVYQCNAKYKDRKYCRTPHLTEDEIKEAFVGVINRLVNEKESILADLEEERKTLADTKALEEIQAELVEKMNRYSDEVETMISRNARIAQDQNEYNIRYNNLAGEYEAVKEQYSHVSAEIEARKTKKREIDRFIRAVEKMDGMVEEFDEALWGSLVDYVTVGLDGDMVFTMVGGIEV